MDLLDYHVPLKNKILLANNAPYITKQLRKTILKISQLEKGFLKTLIVRNAACKFISSPKLNSFLKTCQ